LRGISREIAQREGIVAEDTFHAMLTLERRRAERSRKPFVLMLLDASAVCQNGTTEKYFEKVTSAVFSSSRETDLVGWYAQGVILGVIFTEVSVDGERPIAEVLRSKVTAALADRFERDQVAKVLISVHLFPESWDGDRSGRVADLKLYPDLSQQASRKRIPLFVKRVIDIAGSSLLLLVLLPLWTAIALAIKLTSKGPVIFRQERLGQFGTRFNCLKFRTMYTNNDSRIHKEYVQKFISSSRKKAKPTDDERAIYKITDDPRVTPLGGFLRKTSLDELPQFWNVLRGEMSLVGPRPPVPYEFQVYDIWHRRRILEVKPGITGLWQVNGRSRTRFDEMVRLDLQYTQSWSIWLDLRILVATPRAVFSGEGAY
jgi:exopolysaccharide biosynthesis polyprenyl glycosylphosphotransferase